MPGGIPGVRAAIDELHAAGVKVLIPYNPWVDPRPPPPAALGGTLLRASHATSLFLHCVLLRSKSSRDHSLCCAGGILGHAAVGRAAPAGAVRTVQTQRLCAMLPSARTVIPARCAMRGLSRVF